VKELKGFQRVSLNTGETKTVEFVLKPEHRSFWNVNMKYNEEPGWFTVLVGGNSETTYHTRFEVK
jgi:beta-glucosidase